MPLFDPYFPTSDLVKSVICSNIHVAIAMVKELCTTNQSAGQGRENAQAENLARSTTTALGQSFHRPQRPHPSNSVVVDQ
jgi:hypothetical protein